jgi:undecaprenyl diphosphate synthase
MDILALALSREVPKLQRDGVQIRFVGARDNLSPRVKKGLEDAETATADNAVLTLNVCFNYGGRWDIVTAAAHLAAVGTLITEKSLSEALALAHCGDPDLLIRTGNEKRLSNFLLWQAAYAELYFSALLWPDFDEPALDNALLEFRARERRFGKTSDQIAGYVVDDA